MFRFRARKKIFKSEKSEDECKERGEKDEIERELEKEKGNKR